MGFIRTDEPDSIYRVGIPDYVREHIVFEHELDGDCVEWHFDNEKQVGVVASEILSDYTYIQRSQVINNGSHIRPPQDLVDHLPDFGEDGRAAIYFSQASDNRPLLFLGERRFLSELEEVDLPL